jgi:Rod binding domain-containing protein
MSDLSSLSLSTQTTAFPANSTGTFIPLGNSTAGTQNVDAIASDFEAVFLTQMMEPMFSGSEMSSYFGSGTSGEVYKGFMLNEYGKLIAKAGGIGIAAQVKQELLKLQEVKT